ncbi:MAG: hypothetical protein HQL43_07060 [Alphaproteobacteria bacterium]|nr:hypothetical protein [Alphaproteobacteria bacterium]
MSVYVCSYNPAIKSGFDLQIEAGRIAIRGRNACNVAEGEAPLAMPELVIDLSALKARRDWSDFALWLVGFNYRDNRVFAPFNLYAVSAGSKNDPSQQALTDGRSYSIHIFMPTADSTFLDASFIVYVHPQIGLTCNLPVAEKAWTGQPLVDRPSLAIDAPLEILSGGTVSCVLRLLDHKGKVLKKSPDVYLETTAGYLPRLRVPLTAGRGDFPVSALGLAPGDSFKVKAGFKHYSGVAEHVFQVV